jgi:PEP-CTERM motif
MKRTVFIFSVIALFAISTGVSLADTIGGTGSTCGTCQGSSYTLQWTGSTDGTANTYDITLTIDTSTYTGTGVAIDSVAIKVSSAEGPGGSLDVAPTTLANWAVQDTSGISAVGCDGSGGGFLCAQDTTDPAAVGGTLVWIFDYVSATTPDTSTLGSVVKARYVDANGAKVGDLVSEAITLQPGGGNGGGGGGSVPEPGSIVLLGSGLLVAGTMLRKKLVRS